MLVFPEFKSQKVNWKKNGKTPKRLCYCLNALHLNVIRRWEVTVLSQTKKKGLLHPEFKDLKRL